LQKNLHAPEVKGHRVAFDEIVATMPARTTQVPANFIWIFCEQRYRAQRSAYTFA
jgi:hypothetical protein